MEGRYGAQPHGPAGVKRLPAALLALLAITSSCTKAGGGHWGTAHEIRIAMLNDPTSLNPLFAFLQRQIDMGQLYCDTLVTLDAHNHVVPLLALQVPSKANGGISSDGLTITYHLRHGVRFADGVPLTSRDVAFTYRAILDPRNPVPIVEPYRTIASLRTPDAYTVVIRLRKPWAAAVNELFAASDVAYGILPAHAFRSADVSHSAWNDRPFGSGPFRVVRWVHGDHILLEPNPYAWRKPHLRRIVFVIEPNDNSRFDSIRSHETDVANLTIVQVREAQSKPDLRVVPIMRNGTDYFQFQTAKAPTNDPHMRLALAEAIDRRAIVRDIYHDLEPPATTEVPPVLWAHDPRVTPPPYDPQRAKRFFTSLGHPVHVEIAFVSSLNNARRAATLVQAELAAVGVDASLFGATETMYDAPAADGGIAFGGRFNLSLAQLYGGSDPEESEQWTCDRLAPDGPNFSRWCNHAYDRYYAQQQGTTDRAARIEAFDGMQRIMAEQNVLFPLVYDQEYVAVNPAVKHFAPNMLYDYSGAARWDVIP
jgi:peptide/nickel transport system substrate-binding protein